MSLQEELRNLKAGYSEQLTKAEALELAFQAAELHMRFLKIVKDKNDREEISRNCNLILDEAERIKAADSWESSGDLLAHFEPLQPAVARPPCLPSSLATRQPAKLSLVPANSRKLPANEEILLFKGSKLHGFKFPPWNDNFNTTDFSLSSDHGLFVDGPEIRMSDDQLAILDGWKRPAEALPPPSWFLLGLPYQTATETSPSMKAPNAVDFVQDAATDCSVVASLAAAAARGQKGHPNLLSTLLFPYNVDDDCPTISPNGKYVMRMNFNGCSRAVVIDDRLPVSKSSRILHVVDRNNPCLLWPALVEKGYLKARGGYDFAGSNSGTDLWILTGWIPEQVILQHEETNISRLWPRLFRAFGYGDVIITLGTGKMTPQAENDSGIAGEHDYAVLDMKEEGLRQMLKVKNPWMNSTSWKNHRNRSNTPDRISRDRTSETEGQDSVMSIPSRTSSDQKTSSDGFDDAELNPGTFWIEMNDVMQHFESAYLNWNPALFKVRKDIHFTWDLTLEKGGIGPPGSFTRNPQLAIVSLQGGTMWLLLSRHFKDKQVYARNGDEGYISMYAFSGQVQRVNLSKAPTKRGFYVDSPQSLLQLELPPRSEYTIVVSGEDLAEDVHTFTLSAFANSQFAIDTARSRYTSQTKDVSSWTASSAGGNASSEAYAHNPQFSLALPTRSAVSIVLETLIPNVSVGVRLLHGYGQRVFNITNKDIIKDSGTYRRGCAQAQIEDLDAGTYTIICSTFEPGQQGKFSLLVESSTQHTVKPILREGAGRIRTPLANASFPAGIRVLAAPLAPLRLTRANFTAKYMTPSWSAHARGGPDQALSVHSPTRLTVELGRGPDRRILIASSGGSFSDSTMGLRTEDVDLDPYMTKRSDIWLVLERLGGLEGVGRLEERVAVDMWVDTEEAVSVGVWREWERWRGGC